MRWFMQFMRVLGPDIWYVAQALFKFTRNLVFWFFILMLGSFLWSWVIPYSFKHNPSWLEIFILNPLCDLVWIGYMIVSFFWVFKPKITETDVLIFKIFYLGFESVFNFRSWQNFLRGVLIMTVLLLSLKRVGGYFIEPLESEEMPKGFHELSESELEKLASKK